MQSFDNNFQIPTEKHPLYQLGILILVCSCALIASNLLGAIVIFPLFGLKLSNIEAIINNPQAYPQARMAFLIMQAIASGCAFILAPWILLLIDNKSLRDLNSRNHIYFKPVLFTILIVIFIMPFTSLLIEWNSKIKFPELLKPFEEWATEKENSLRLLTEYLTNFEGKLELIIGFLVIAIIPAIGEELVFRGFIQNIILKWSGNPHVAILIAAFIFSSIHMQFFGFIPRMLLGALFGYLYFWSGNLLIPIIGHFINNGFTLLMVYLKNKSLVNFDIESSDAMPISSIAPTLLLVLVLIYSFYRFYSQKKELANG